MKYYLVAGEASGDLHGSNLMREIKNIDDKAEFRFFGGDLMQEQGGTLVQHYRHMAFMGLSAVVMNIRKILNNMKTCRRDIKQYKPEVVILIDLPGFNLRMAKFAKLAGFRVIYYISPTVWAWKENRVKIIKKYVDKLFVILPFEVGFYKKHNYQVEFVGHPLMDAYRNFLESNKAENDPEIQGIKNKGIIALLAGSRKQEIDKLLPEMVAAIKHFPNEQFVLAAAPSIEPEYYHKFNLPENIKIIVNKTYGILSAAKAAVVTSGTATLETALFEVPEVVVYKTNTLTFRIGILLVNLKKFKYFSLVNLIMDREVVKELLQFNIAEGIKEELGNMLNNPDHYNRIKQDMKTLKEKLGDTNGSKEMAGRIVRYIKQ